MSAFNQAAAGGVCTHPLRWEEGTVTKLLFFFIFTKIFRINISINLMICGCDTHC